MNSRLSAGIGIAPDSGAATDLNRLHQLKVGKNRDSEANVHKVAQEFESLFLNEMMKAMRSANAVFAEGNFMNSNESKTYQDMHDQQLAITMSKQNGVGLADVLERQLSKTLHGAGSSRPNPFAQVAASSGVTAATPAADEAVVRDDSKLLNQRRISLPPRLADRLLAGIVPPAGGSEAQAQAPQNWLAAKSYPAPADKSLSIADSDAITGRRLAQPPLAPGKAAFSSPEEFVATMLPMAQQAADRIGVDPLYLVAQAALETGWGKSVMRQQDGSSSHNLFGIKATGSWQGAQARAITSEFKGGQMVKETADFRSYDSYQDSFHDLVTLLQSNNRYKDVLNAADKPEQFVRELQKAGYATDPEYASKISQIAKQMKTYQSYASTGSLTNL